MFYVSQLGIELVATRLGELSTILEIPVSILGKRRYPGIASSEFYAIWEPSVRHRIQNYIWLIR